MLEHIRTTLPRPWWWDGGIALIFVAAGMATLVRPDLQLGGSGVPVTLPVRAGVVVLVCLPALVRTRRPVTALVVALPLVVLDGVLGLSIVSAFVLADLLYCAVLHAPVRTSDVVRRTAIGAWCVLGVALLVTEPDVGAVLRTALSAAALLLIPVLWAGEVRRPVEEAAAEREAAAQAARIAALDRQAAVADERARIARDLHDSVAGHLSAISLQSQAALRADDETRDRVLRAVRENSVRALDEMRALIEVLRDPGGASEAGPPPSDTAPAVGLAELDALTESARATGLTVRLLLDGETDRTDDGDLPPAVDLTAYRILQEALTNVSRHAPGAAVDLVVERRDDTLVLEVVNQRVGSDTSRPGTGTGVDGMRIRAEAVGGHAEAGPEEHGGRWRVRAVLPVPAGAQSRGSR